MIPSLKSEMTDHADGMVRFMDRNTVIDNSTPYKIGFEKKLNRNGIRAIDFQYISSPKDSAEGCYINFLKAENHIFFPVFGADTDETAVPVNINENAEDDGVLNYIGW